MPNITFRFVNGDHVVSPAADGDSLLDIARKAGVAIDAPCSGNGTCGKCRVRLLEGSTDSPATRHITEADYAQGWRLACGSAVTGDAVVEVPESASAFRTGIRTADLSDPAVRHAFDDVQAMLTEAGVTVEKAIESLAVVLDEPSLDDTLPDNERLERAVQGLTGANKVNLSYFVLRKLARVLRECAFSVRCVIERRDYGVKVVDVLPGGDTDPICVLAIDIGTTTVTGTLANAETGELLARASAGNGQIRFGADVINRIIESSRPGGSERLRKAVVEETLIPLIGSLCRDAGLSQERIYRVCIAGNTTMSHLLLGLYSDPIRMEPFIPSFFRSRQLRAADVIPGLYKGAGLILAPNVGSYVGGDITAGVLASGLWTRESLTLFIDLGTNGELVLGNNDYMMCCACSAGPAFEGGDISCGMRATNGAIQAISVDKDTMEPTLDVIGPEGQKPVGVCGSGLLDAVASLFLTGIVDARGKFAREGRRIRRDEHGMGRYVIAFEEDSADGREIALNEVDLDNFIRAKGAIFSAIRLLLNQVGLEMDDLEHILIAGGIGGGIDFDNAVTIGMLPDVDRSKFSYIGNSSLAGAYAMVMSRSAQEKVRELGANMMYVELSNEPGYMDQFVSACFLPHTDRHLFPSVEVG